MPLDSGGPKRPLPAPADCQSAGCRTSMTPGMKRRHPPCAPDRPCRLERRPTKAHRSVRSSPPPLHLPAADHRRDWRPGSRGPRRLRRSPPRNCRSPRCYQALWNRSGRLAVEIWVRQRPSSDRRLCAPAVMPCLWPLEGRTAASKLSLPVRPERFVRRRWFIAAVRVLHPVRIRRKTSSLYFAELLLCGDEPQFAYAQAQHWRFSGALGPRNVIALTSGGLLRSRSCSRS